MKVLLKRILRRILSPVLYFLYYKWIRKNYEISRNGKPLKHGITAVVAAKNEDYTIPLCLKSLIGIADQIICIDNGSEDDTLKLMQDFKNKHGNEVEIKILSMPGALLGDCREAGLKETNYQWHLRWDADMIAKTTGGESMKILRETVLKNNRPRTIQLPRTNLYGDLYHCEILDDVVDPGEPILVRFSKYVCYKEYGKFDTIKVPFFYNQIKEKNRYYFHCAGLKSLDNLIHRFHYFDWRNLVNQNPQNKELQNLDEFKHKRNLELFGTNNVNEIKFRYQRQLVYHFTKYNPEKYGDYPDVLKEHIHNKLERFKVIYKNNKPYLRQDLLDYQMLNYVPIKEDLNWSPEKFLKIFLNDDQCKKLGIN